MTMVRGTTEEKSMNTEITEKRREDNENDSPISFLFSVFSVPSVLMAFELGSLCSPFSLCPICVDGF